MVSSGNRRRLPASHRDACVYPAIHARVSCVASKIPDNVVWAKDAEGKLRHFLISFASIVAMTALTGCLGRQAPITYAASPTTQEGAVRLNLVLLLDPTATHSSLEVAFAHFPRDAARRDAVVGALLMASERNCDIYMENLRGAQSAWRTGSSLTSLALGTAGSIVTDSASARLLSGLSGASGSISGRLDENLMGSMAADVLLQGVRAAREPYRQAIVRNLTHNTRYEAWPIEVAVADVFQYHGRCNVISGLAAAQRALETEIARESAPQQGTTP